MLQLKDIRKKYITGEFEQIALDGVSLNLREQELVAILGPSGSGKSTLLNVIGGLDQYDSGDLIINGTSTKRYSDRDWDSYRNHTIGFIFQSYNLIPHQTILANVELALTISGIPMSERRKRAVKALEDVGLGKQLHKKPNQMSGGQMQRVAIARALVNNPSILLADEPTGALDSETSIQVMELLKEVAKDRLVVMVTHNPELAYQYASRIVTVKDGRILDDSNPFEVDETTLEAPLHKNMGRSSMSFLSALALSFNNLKTKKGRTLLTSFAGSIGIIGIALIMALSSGFQAYIDQIQEDTLASYPLTISAESADMTSALVSMMAPGLKPDLENKQTISEQPVLAKMFAHIGTNDLASFNRVLKEKFDIVDHAVNTIQYGYGIRPRIYSDDPQNILQVNPATLFKRITGNDMISALMDADAFQELLDNEVLMNSQYQILDGRWPESYNELVFILPSPNRIPDHIAYTLGIKSMDSLDKMIDLLVEGKEIPLSDEVEQWSYSDIMGLRFKLISAPDLYRYNSEFQVWEDMTSDPSYMSDLIQNGEELKVVGIVCPQDGSTSSTLSPGIGYLPSLTEHIIHNSAESDIVKEQILHPDINVFSGSPFGEEEKSELNLEDMISIDTNAISSAFGMDVSESDFIELLEDCLREIESATDVDTTAARQAFLSTLNDFSAQMLTDYVSQNADAAGEVRLTLADADPMAESFLQTEYAESRLSALSNLYFVPTDAFKSVYKPLLVGVVTSYIAREIQIEAPDSEASSSANSEIFSPSSVELIHNLNEFEPMEETPFNTQDYTSQKNGSPSEESSTNTGETIPKYSVPETDALPETLPENAIPDSTAQDEIFPDDLLPNETAPGNLLPDETVPDSLIPNESLPEQDTTPNLPIRPDQVYAVMTVSDIPSAVSDFAGDPIVSQAADIMSVKMMESTVMDSMITKLAGLDDILRGFIRSNFYVDQDRIAGAFQFNMDETELHRLFDAISGKSKDRSYASNLRSLDYAELGSPTFMAIYMRDFAGKEDFIQFIEDYNTSAIDAHEEDRVIQYNDMTGAMMSSIRTIIDSVSYVLIAFVAVSLVVSSIMIGIITYISVMERTKEIGILRAMGASKRNISQVFNAETFIVGLCSGFLGIGISLLLIIPGNHLIHHLMNNAYITAHLPVTGAIILILLSMLLTLLGGLIPSRQAAKKDPVIALRSE